MKKTELICGGRCSGKTMMLINKADGFNGYIVCHSQKEASRISSIALDLGCSINFPITYREFLEGAYSPVGVGKVHIDNVFDFIASVSHVPIETLALNLDDIKKVPARWE